MDTAKVNTSTAMVVYKLMWVYINSKDTINCFFFNCDSLHARLKATTRHGVTRKKDKKIKPYRKSIYKQPPVKRCLLILELKPFRS